MTYFCSFAENCSFCSDFFVYLLLNGIFYGCKLLVFITLYHFCSICSKMDVFLFFSKKHFQNHRLNVLLRLHGLRELDSTLRSEWPIFAVFAVKWVFFCIRRGNSWISLTYTILFIAVFLAFFSFFQRSGLFIYH